LKQHTLIQLYDRYHIINNINIMILYTRVYVYTYLRATLFISDYVYIML